MIVHFTVNGKPAGYDRNQARWRATPKRQAEWRRSIQMAFRDAAGPGFKPPELPVKVVAYFWGTNADLDNLMKEACDALNGLAWTDDGCIIELAAYAPDRVLGPGGHAAMRPLKKGESRSEGLAMGITYLVR